MNDSESAKAATTTTVNSGGLLSKSRYKLWAIGAILLLALWSMFTGSVTLKWSGAGADNNPLSDSFDSPVRDLDILEVEEREKMVRKFWNVYTHSRTAKLPRFWQEAFEAAYEHLATDVAGSRDAAISEIAKMSLVSVDVEPSSLNSVSGGSRKSLKRAFGRRNKA